jgi:hypothetical protein
MNLINWEDLPAKSQERILLQQRSVSLVITQDNQSISSSITGATGINRLGTKHGSVTLNQDVVIILSSDTTKPPIPIAIHSPMAHVTLQTGLSNEERDCPALKCVFDSGAALSTANFHFMEAVIRQYPHILKKIYLSDEYAAIVLSSIVNTPDSAPITTKLNVGFDIHLPYTTKDGNNASLLVTAGPDVAVNLILGLPFIKATGMIADFVDNVCEAKNLLCDLFPIDFKRAMKSIPVFADNAAVSQSHGTQERSVLQVLGMLRSLYGRKPSTRSLHPSHHFPQGMHLVARPSVSSTVGFPLPL